MSLSEHLTSCGAWTGHSCTCWLDRHLEVADDSKVASIAELEAENKRLQCCGNCYGSGHHGGAFGCFRDVDHLFINTEPRDNCHFDPSRWVERSAP